MGDTFKNDLKLAILAVTHQGDALRFLGEELKDDEDVVYNAC